MHSLPLHECEVIVIDNASSDDTREQVRSTFPGVRLIALPRNRGAVARNVGVARARTPFVAFADDDSWWAPGALALAVRHLSCHPGLALVAARILLGPSQVPDPLCAVMDRAPLGRDPSLPGPDILGFAACAVVVRRQAFLDVGGFDDVVTFGGEEERLALDLAAAGWRMVYVHDLVVHHWPSAQRATRAEHATLLCRNRLLTAWMRRPWAVAMRASATALATAGSARSGALQAMPRLPRALARRRPVPAGVEQLIRRLEAADSSGVDHGG